MTQQSSHPSWIGHTISGRYKIETLLGQGGMSSVYKATDPNLRRTVAIKLIHPHLSSDPEFVRRFEHEAAAVAQLRHQNIIQVFDFNHDGDVYYMVLEYLPGETLQEQLRRLSAANKTMPAQEAINVMAVTCDAVAYAHNQGMIHRDLKPANLMMNPNGQPILMDFGVAKMLGTAQHTATGAIIGTAKYMSPEQARGDRPDERTDIYSLGVILYEMVAGVTPFEGDSTVAILMKHVTEQVPDIRAIKSDLSPQLAEVIEKALAKNRKDRYQSAAEMAAALRAVDLSAPAVAVPPPPPPVPDAEQTMLHAQPGATQAIPASAPPATSPAPAATPATEPKKGGLPMWLLGAGAVLLLAIVAGLILIAVNLGGGDSTPDESAQTDENAALVEQPDATEATPTEAGEAAPEVAVTDTPIPPSPTPEDLVATEETIDSEPETSPETTEAPATPESADESSTEPATTSEASDSLPTPASTATSTATPAPTATPTEEPTETPEPAVRIPEAPPGMVFVPPGFFAMGSTNGQPDERPEHPVLVDGFFIDRLEVTNAEYRQCVEAGVCTPSKTENAFTYTGYRDDPAFDNYPVISVDWDQAVTYCGFAGKRLPTEAEWEYAASGPDNLVYPWGNSFDVSLSAASADDVQPVGSYPGNASPFGALDMAGNVGEWVADVFVDGFYSSSPPSNPVGSGTGAGRIFRGGSFANPDGAFYTTSRRYGNARSFSEVDIGLRCAADAPNAEPPADVVDTFCQLYGEFKPGVPCP
jgi:serine/threonine-protein kinase